MTVPSLTQSELKKLLHYDPDTGIFTHKLPRRGVSVGKEAGYPQPDGYRYVTLLGFRYVSHRLIWLYVYGRLPINQLDHVNRDRSDNRLINLREVTAAENKQNLGISSKNKSGFRGVSFDKNNNLWRASISVNNKPINLGRYPTILEASKAYALAAKKYHSFNSMAAS